MIPRKNRLPLSSFPKQAPVAARTSLFVVKLRENGLGHDRFGVITGAKSEPLAVQRHRIRRLILQQARTLPPRGRDYLFLASARAKDFTKARLAECFDKIPS